MSCVVEGYEDAVEQEQLARNLVYLNQCETVCGEPIRSITPYSLAVLSAIRTPFLSGGDITPSVVAQFIWALHCDYSATSWWKRRQLRKRLAKLTLEQCALEIFAFIDLTFMDRPQGGKEEKPIASSIAWLVYRFRHEPWGLKERETSHTPLRKLYQELRCWERENAEVPANKSDIKKAEWVGDLNDWLRQNPVKNGMLLADWNADCRALANKEITQKQFEARRAQAKRWDAEMTGMN